MAGANFCAACMEKLENWCVYRLIIVGVPFDGLKNNGVTATELLSKN